MNKAPRDEMAMGQGIRSYRPPVFSLNRTVNRLFAPSARSAFPDMESAVIIQAKKIPDVSFWQGLIDWNTMRGKTDAVIIRAGQNLWEDIKWWDNWSAAKARGMLRGAYWFYDDRVDPGRQAGKFDSLLANDRPEMEVIVDWEISFGGNFRGLPNVVSMMERMESYGYKVAMYTGYWWFREHSNAITNKSQYAYLKARPLHLAWYTEDAREVLIPNPWLELWLWQFGTPAEGPAHGAPSAEIDMNFVNMTTEQFYNRYGEHTPPPEPEPPVIGETMFYKVTYATVNLRSSAAVTATNDLGNTDDTNLKLNDIIEVNDDPPVVAGGYSWRIVLRWWRANVEKQLPPSPTGVVWAAEKAGSTGYYMVPASFTPPIPAPSLPAYFTAHDAAGNVLARYNKQ